MTNLRSICLLLLLWPAASIALASDGETTEQPWGELEEIRVEVHAPFAAQMASEWSWRRRGSASFLSRLHRFRAPFGQDSRMVLIEDELLDRLVARLLRCVEQSDMPPEQGRGPMPAPESSGWQRLFVLDDQGRSFFWQIVADEQGLVADGHPLEACLVQVREEVEQRLAPDARLPSRIWAHPFWLTGEAGLVRLLSDPPAQLWLDEVPTGLQTPVLNLRVEPGTHRVRLVTHEGLEQELLIEVHAGQTTSVHLDLSR